MIQYLLDKAKNMKLLDWFLFKFSLVLFGIMIGAYFSNLVKSNISILLSFFVILEVIFLYRFFKN